MNATVSGLEQGEEKQILDKGHDGAQNISWSGINFLSRLFSHFSSWRTITKQKLMASETASKDGGNDHDSRKCSSRGYYLFNSS